MRLVLERILEDETDSAESQGYAARRETDRILRPDAAAWKTAERIAYNVRKDHDRTDGFKYDITSSAVDMTVTITLSK